MPRWQRAKYASLSPDVQKAYDVYVQAFGAAKELASKLMELAGRDWIAANSNGIDGKFISFNATNGTLMWTMANKKKSGRGYKDKGEDVPSARPLTPAEALARLAVADPKMKSAADRLAELATPKEKPKR